jgi:hypothetical protein
MELGALIIITRQPTGCSINTKLHPKPFFVCELKHAVGQTGCPHLTSSLILQTPFKGKISSTQSGSLQTAAKYLSQTSSQCFLSLVQRKRSDGTN